MSSELWCHRWVRFEEDVEECGKRWSKPYVPSIPLSAFMDFRQCFNSGIVALDVPGTNMQDIIGKSRKLPRRL